MMRRTLKLKSLAWKILDEKTQREGKCLFSAWLCKTPHERRPDTQSYDFRQSFWCDHSALEKDKILRNMNFLKAFKQCHTCGYTRVWMIMQRIVFKPRPKQKPALSLPFPSPWSSKSAMTTAAQETLAKLEGPPKILMKWARNPKNYR